MFIPCGLLLDILRDVHTVRTILTSRYLAGCSYVAGCCKMRYGMIPQVKSVKAGRSLRRATQKPMKGALEIGLWAASRPEGFARANKVRVVGGRRTCHKTACQV